MPWEGKVSSLKTSLSRWENNKLLLRSGLQVLVSLYSPCTWETTWNKICQKKALVIPTSNEECHEECLRHSAGVLCSHEMSLFSLYFFFFPSTGLAASCASWSQSSSIQSRGFSWPSHPATRGRWSSVWSRDWSARGAGWPATSWVSYSTSQLHPPATTPQFSSRAHLTLGPQYFRDLCIARADRDRVLFTAKSGCLWAKLCFVLWDVCLRVYRPADCYRAYSYSWKACFSSYIYE